MQTLLVLLLLLISPKLAAEAVHYEHMRVQKLEAIVEDDNGQTQEANILARLKTKEGGLFSQEDFDDDLKTLAKEFDRIEPRIEVVGGGLEIKLQLWVKPTIQCIIWQGNKEISQDKLSKSSAFALDRSSIDRPLIKPFTSSKVTTSAKASSRQNSTTPLFRSKASNEVEILISIKEGRSGKIDDIVFHNLTKKEQNELLGLIFTKGSTTSLQAGSPMKVHTTPKFCDTTNSPS